MKKLPKSLYKYFWDTDPAGIDLEKSSSYVVVRLMDYGKTEAVKWMRRELGDEHISEALRVRRGISRRSAIYWARQINMPLEEVKCLQMPYRQIPYGV